MKKVSTISKVTIKIMEIILNNSKFHSKKYLKDSINNKYSKERKK